MGFDKCTICNEWHWDDVGCAPIYNVYYEDYMGDEPKKIRATNHEEAALKFAEYYNVNCDYCLMGDQIEVKVEKDGVYKWFNVSAEPDIYYSSSEVKK